MKRRKRGKELRFRKEALRRDYGSVVLKRVWKGKETEKSKNEFNERE